MNSKTLAEKLAFVDRKVLIWKKNCKEALSFGFRVDTLYQVGGSPLGDMNVIQLFK